jgi:RNA polymerase sigma-70 factor (ECF subfamily)
MRVDKAAVSGTDQPVDAELVWLARGGDAAAFGVLLERHRAGLYASALGRLGEREAAADAVQETFVIALRRLDQLRDAAKVGEASRLLCRPCAGCGSRLRAA